MKWLESEASKCRWSDYIEQKFYDWEIIWDGSLSDYQGTVEFVAYGYGQYAYVYYNYGSCGGCDGWEDMEEEARAEDFKRIPEFFDNYDEFMSFLEMKRMKDAIREINDSYDIQFKKGFEKIILN